VNGETAFDPLMTGEAELPASACPGGTGPCSGLVGRSYVAPASERRYLISPRPEGDTLHLTAEGRPLTTTGFTVVSFCDPHADTGADGNNRDPGLASGCPTNPNRSRVRQLTLSWTGPATLRAELAARDVRHLGALHLRTAVDFQDSLNTAGQPQDMGITLVGGNGRRVTMPAREYSAALMPPPGDAARQLTLNGVRIPLADFAAGGIDLTDVAAVELNFGGPDRPASGSVQLAQLSFQEPVSAADAGSNVDGTAGRATANVVGAGQPHGDLPATGGATDLSIGLGVLAAGLGARRLSRRRIFAAGRGAVSSFRQ
jgi:hypothetical protein